MKTASFRKKNKQKWYTYEIQRALTSYTRTAHVQQIIQTRTLRWMSTENVSPLTKKIFSVDFCWENNLSFYSVNEYINYNPGHDSCPGVVLLYKRESMFSVYSLVYFVHLNILFVCLFILILICHFWERKSLYEVWWVGRNDELWGVDKTGRVWTKYIKYK